jgi:hypothetical protein
MTAAASLQIEDPMPSRHTVFVRYGLWQDMDAYIGPTGKGYQRCRNARHPPGRMNGCLRHGLAGGRLVCRYRAYYLFVILTSRAKIVVQTVHAPYLN